jgi:hypothetical protein
VVFRKTIGPAFPEANWNRLKSFDLIKGNRPPDIHTQATANQENNGVKSGFYGNL